MSMQEFLARSGVRTSEGELLELFAEALDTIRSRATGVAPWREFSADELRQLKRGSFSFTRPTIDPLAATAAQFAALLHDSVTVAEAADELGVDRSRIRQQLLDRSLYGTKVRGEWRIPRFQLGVPGIGRVLRSLPADLHPVEVWRWFDAPVAELTVGEHDVSPLEWLRSGGDPAQAAALAADL